MNTRYLLQRELTRRCQANANYSLRAFAKAIGMSPATLSLVLAGKRKFSQKAKAQVAARLGLSGPDTAAFLKEKAKAAEEAPEDFHFLALDTFAVIADWYHLAILSLLELEDVDPRPAQIARYFGIHEQEAKAALERLERLQLIEKIKGRWRQSGKAVRFENTQSTAATIRFNRQLLERALHSLENDSFAQRSMAASVFEMDSKNLPKARLMLKTMRRRLGDSLKGKGRPNQVYCLSVQLFPLSDMNKKENSNG